VRLGAAAAWEGRGARSRNRLGPLLTHHTRNRKPAPTHPPTQQTQPTDYKSYPVFVSKIRSLMSRYGGIRRVRSDGNCFFRATAFGLLEWLLVNEADAECQK